MTVERRWWWWIGGGALVALAIVASVIAPGADVSEVLFVFSMTWALTSLGWLVWRLWRWVTYRVGVRLFITYFLIGVLPVFFAIAFASVGLYIAMGQYTSVRLGSEFEYFGWALADDCKEVLEIAYETGPDAALSVLGEFASDPPYPLSTVHWWAHIDGRTSAVGPDLEELDFDWLPEGGSRSVARSGGTVYSLTSHRAPSGDRVVALIPFNESTGLDLSAQWWFDVAFFDLDDSHAPLEHTDGDVETEFSAQASRDGSINLTISGEYVESEEIWPEWTEGGKGFFSRPFVVWFRVVADLVDLETGEKLEGLKHLALLRTSPKNVWADFTLSRYELAAELWSVIAALGLFFLVFYGLAMATAATMIFSISRSTSRLTTGARAIERGDLGYRVPVKRRDQLGDLARSFNHMTHSVQSMLADVAEKERLARELELARQIQESLLPARCLEVGPVTVRATFRPAAEVGGDYFDVFSLSDDHLVVAIGDVAGHGLSTGLLMASLKSSVAALVHEGYGGSDLIDKVHGLLRDHGHDRTMVTLTVVAIDLKENRLELANAGHCPPFLIAPDGEPEELLASALPMGSRLCRSKSLERPFPSGSLLVLYSDGLVEAVSPEGEPFGYEHLETVLGSASRQSGEALTSTLLEALAEHADGTPAADDLTILIVERS